MGCRQVSSPFAARMLVLSLAAGLLSACGGSDNINSNTSNEQAFQRIAVFPAFLNTDVDTESVAEIVSASADGMTLAYTDGESESLGLVDITDPASPTPLGSVQLTGEPTSVAILGNDLALTAVNTSPNFLSPTGVLEVVDIANQTVVRRIDLGGQPDAIAISADQRYAAIAIENERDEDLNDGALPQAPAGFMVIVDLLGQSPANWTTRTVDVSGLANVRFPTDPEPEFVSINSANIAVLTLQENNSAVLIDLATGDINTSLNMGAIDLNQIDTNENDLIELNSQLTKVLREPDGVVWLSNSLFATANEGDLEGGSRSFSIFDTGGNVMFDSGNTLDHRAVRLGHYPENRSENRGTETENVQFAEYAGAGYLFAALERASVISVYRMAADGTPEFAQTLPAGLAPEGLLAIPQRNLFIAASEADDRDDKVRSVLNIYRLQDGPPAYPTVVSTNRNDNTPIPWGALSGLALVPGDNGRGFGIHDSFYQQTRIYTMELGAIPARITGEILLSDSGGLLSAVSPDLVSGPLSVNLDSEGIATRPDGGFWLVSEGSGSVDSNKRPVTTPNLLIQADADGTIVDVVRLPEATDARQRRHGFEGVTAVGTGNFEQVYVAFQREWVNDPDNLVRIGRYDVSRGQWSFFYYPTETPTSPNGGWVGLSEISALANGDLAVIERDNQAGPDARIKRIYRFSIAGLMPLSEANEDVTPGFPVVDKTLVRDLLPDLQATGGLALEKIEGMAVADNGTSYVINDNDGVDDSNGETQLLVFPGLF